jgi:Na+-transporting methylmalonyl-CoA/oxaloacetate decarboxylase gamma subunit
MLNFNPLWYKFILAVAVIGLSACAAKEEVQGEVAADSTAVVAPVVADSTKIDTDSIKSPEVKPVVEGEAAK